MNKFLQTLIIGSCAFLLGSCFEFEQEIDLKSDGSGEFQLEVRVPDMGNSSDDDEGIMSDEEAEAKAEASGVEIIENSVTKANGKITTTFRVAFDNMDELNEFMKEEDKEGDNQMNFRFSLEKDGGVTTLRHQIVSEKEEKDEDDPNAAMGELMMANMFKDSYYTIRWSLPSEVIEASDDATIEGKNVSFKIPMVALMNNSGVDVSASYKSGTPTWIFFAIGGVVLLFVLLVLPRMLKKS